MQMIGALLDVLGTNSDTTVKLPYRPRKTIDHTIDCGKAMIGHVRGFGAGNDHYSDMRAMICDRHKLHCASILL